MKTSDVEAALAEMDYELVENQSGLELPCSTPCQLAAVDGLQPDLDAFEDALQTRDFARLPDRGVISNDDGQWVYETQVLSKADYQRTAVKCWHDGAVRIYPRETTPSLTDLAALTRAIEIGFDTTLEHDPLEGSDD